jgi:hypothetical protein
MQISDASASPEAREHFADLARTWLRLAGDLESGQALIDLLDDLSGSRRSGQVKYRTGYTIHPS